MLDDCQILPFNGVIGNLSWLSLERLSDQVPDRVMYIGRCALLASYITLTAVCLVSN